MLDAAALGLARAALPERELGEPEPLLVGERSEVWRVPAGGAPAAVVKLYRPGAAASAEHERPLAGRGEALACRAAARAGLPAPRLHAELSAPVAGVELALVCDELPGVRYTDALVGTEPPAPGRAAPAALAHAAGRLLARLHAAPVPAGLVPEPLRGLPPAEAAREWWRLFHAVLGRIARAVAPHDPDGAAFYAALGERCADEARRPPPELPPLAFLHGDFTGVNVLVAANGAEPAATGLVDWEWSSVGDPRLDLAKVLACAAGRTPNRIYRDDAGRDAFWSGYGAPAEPVPPLYSVFHLLAPLTTMLPPHGAPLEQAAGARTLAAQLLERA